MAPPDRVGAVILLEIADPKLLAIEIVRGQVAIAEMHDDQFAVGHGRGAGQIMFRVKGLPAAAMIARRGAVAHRAAPQDRAAFLGNFEKHQIVVGHMAGQEDGIAPDGRRTVSPLGQFALPDHARFFRPGHRESRLAAGTIGIGTAPLRPVFARREVAISTTSRKTSRRMSMVGCLREAGGVAGFVGIAGSRPVACLYRNMGPGRWVVVGEWWVARGRESL